MDCTWENSPFYRREWVESGVHPSSLKSSIAEASSWMHLGAASNEPGTLCWQDPVCTEVCDPHGHFRLDDGREVTPTCNTLERTSRPMIRH